MLNDKEYYRAMMLEVSITKIGLTEKFTSQLEEILGLQFSDNYQQEVRGSIFYRHGLDLEVIEPQLIKEVKEGLALFVKGDYSKADLLRDFSGEVLDSFSKHTKACEILRAINYYFDSLSSRENKNVLYQRRKKLADDFREFFLEKYSDASPKELGEDKEGFIGFFHVHQNASPPSGIDLETNLNLHIPELVFSATALYRTSGVKIYLVTKGNYTKLYDGALRVNSDGRKVIS